LRSARSFSTGMPSNCIDHLSRGMGAGQGQWQGLHAAHELSGIQ
jgi:hypothetical protein